MESVLSILFGVIGLFGFEAIRLYKCIWGQKPILPEQRSALYIATLLLLAIFSGACAFALANGNLINSLFIGFSVPTGIRAILEPPSKAGAPQLSSVEVDDFDVETLATGDEDKKSRKSFLAWLRSYFG